ncbi:BglG family transcriptional antiterminator /transcriptional regulator [Cytobacillus firmus]|uniref:BglG family transcriptional antiterminator /transcriptional regulator n=2 Tax=Cytobacillus TaxID=2675230 RepID=A0A366K0Y4_CYTFI|nr:MULTISPECIES: BglG family transcription antiterminator [Cytobacillus]RBP95439.1 BglG family transcriptional antiterminator /transcriptional regulator [Cytobacillus firmus]TDX44280.1 BglG family transcriptional antiterminator /transcriptional regulator [Cytobacillus oceanisediminis]
MVSKRQKDIVLSLMKAKEPVSAEWMAKELGVSDRTIRNEIKELQSQGSSLGIIIESVRGKGYLLNIKDYEMFEKEYNYNANEAIDENKLDFSEQENRVLYILKRFLLEKEPIKIETLEEELFVSKPKVQNDLKIVREILESYQLKLVTRPHYGTQVEGDEYMKRLCLSNYILSRNSNLIIESNSFHFLDEKLFEKIKEIIIKKVNEYKIEISDIALENLATHITIGCKRIEEGFVIENLEHDLTGKYPFEKIVANEIVKEVEAFTGFKFPKSEINYIIVHLLGTKLIHKNTLKEFSQFDELGSIMHCMLERLKTDLNWDFYEDEEFIQGLTLHIRPAMNRLRYNMNIRNPLLNEIKMKYPSAFEGAAIASRCIEEYLEIEVGEHEIAYIALHIGVALERMKTRQKMPKRVIVVCASGVGSARLLYYRLQNVFNDEIDIVASTNYYQLKEYDLSSIDFIISTIPIKEDLDVPVQVVNTFLGEEDIEKIREGISPVKKNEEQSYLDDSRVFIHKNFEDKESVIRFLCEELCRQRLVSKEYVNSVLEREELAPTSFGNLVAIPHPLSPVTEETFWTICTLKKPIEWTDKHMVQFICLLNIRKVPNKDDLESMYKRLIALIENSATVKKILKSESAEEIIRILTVTN